MSTTVINSKTASIKARVDDTTATPEPTDATEFARQITSTLQAANSAIAATESAAVADQWVAALVNTRRQLDALLALSVNTAQRADVESRFRAGSDHRYLTNRHRLSAADATKALTAARFIAPHTLADGTTITACEPETAKAAHRGSIGNDHLAVMARELDRLPETWTERRPEVERALLAVACQRSPQALATESRAFIDSISTRDVTDRDRKKRRGLWLGPQGEDGMSYLHGWLTPIARAYFETATTTLGQKGLNNIDDDFSPRGTLGPASTIDHSDIEAARTRDGRGIGQRAHDGLAAALEWAANKAETGESFKGLPAHLIITATLEQIEQASGTALTATGTSVSISEMLTAAEDIHPILTLFDHSTNSLLHYGRKRRTASREQRFALFARDRGCSRPGCHHGAFGAEAHHVIEWAAGGLTDVGNLTLACRADHRHINTTSTGLRTSMRGGQAAWSQRSTSTTPDNPQITKLRPGEQLNAAVSVELVIGQQMQRQFLAHRSIDLLHQRRSGASAKRSRERDDASGRS